MSNILPKHFYYKNNRLQQLRGFYFTAQLGSVSKAAKHMSLNQSTVTMQVQSLERDLETSLFERHGPKLILTQEGQNLYSLIIPHIEGIDHIYERFLAANQQAELAQLNIGANHISIMYLLPKVIQTFMQQNPYVKVKVFTNTIKEGYQQLLEEKIHFFLGPLPKKQKRLEEYSYWPLKEYKTVLITRHDHALTKRSNISMENISQYPLIRLAPHLSTIPTLESMISTYNLHSNLEFAEGDWIMLKKYVRAGIANAIVSEICIEDEDKKITAIPLDRYFPNLKYGIIHKKNKFLLPHVRKLISALDPQFPFQDQ